MSTKGYATLTQLFPDWRTDVLSGEPPTLWRVGGTEWDPVELGPGLVTIIAAPPGGGKTALVMQNVIDALRLNESLRVLVANVEMHPNVLLDRQLARLSGVSATDIRFRTIPPDAKSRVDAAMGVLAGIGDRIAFHTGRFTLADVAQSADSFGANLIVLDYIQHFTLDHESSAKDVRTEMNRVMGQIRKFALAGRGVLAVSSVSRQQSAKGNGYKNLGLASLKESGQLEYDADNVWFVEPVNDSPELVRLWSDKARYGETGELLLQFDKPLQSFTPVLADMSTVTNRPKSPTVLTADVMRAAWDGATNEESDDGL